MYKAIYPFATSTGWQRDEVVKEIFIRMDTLKKLVTAKRYLKFCGERNNKKLQLINEIENVLHKSVTSYRVTVQPRVTSYRVTVQPSVTPYRVTVQPSVTPYRVTVQPSVKKNLLLENVSFHSFSSVLFSENRFSITDHIYLQDCGHVWEG